MHGPQKAVGGGEALGAPDFLHMRLQQIHFFGGWQAADEIGEVFRAQHGAIEGEDGAVHRLGGARVAEA